MKHALFVCLVLALPVFAQDAAPVVKLPEAVKGRAGSWIAIAPLEITGGTVEWEIPAGLVEVDLAAIFGPDIAAKAKAKVVQGDTDGSFVIIAWTAKGDRASKLARCTVIIAGGTPPPSPTPIPIPPVIPDSAFVKSLKAAWAKEPDADKANIATLADIYRKGATYSTDDRLKTVKEINDIVKAAREKFIGQTLGNVRAAVNAELQATLPTLVSAPLDAATRDLCFRTFNRVADSLAVLK